MAPKAITMDITQICPDCQEHFLPDTTCGAVSQRCLSCQKKQVPDDTEANYSRPEQRTRKFTRKDIEDLLQSLDNKIHRLEGMRGVEFDRNFLHSNESNKLNRAKLTRMIVTKYMEQNP